jgi:hypothetical protein
VVLKIGVTCKHCGKRIPVEDEYIPGVRGAELAASLYQPDGLRTSDFVNKAWQKRLSCENPGCRQTREYASSDLLLYDDYVS